jgi:hypothetical protein
MMLSAIVRASYRYDPGITAEIRNDYIQAAWISFIEQPGQEHWHCECSSTEKPK